MCGAGATNGGKVRKWCRLFKGDRTNVHDKERSWRPFLAADDVEENVKDKTLGKEAIQNF